MFCVTSLSVSSLLSSFFHFWLGSNLPAFLSFWTFSALPSHLCCSAPSALCSSSYFLPFELLSETITTLHVPPAFTRWSLMALSLHKRMRVSSTSNIIFTQKNLQKTSCSSQSSGTFPCRFKVSSSNAAHNHGDLRLHLQRSIPHQNYSLL